MSKTLNIERVELTAFEVTLPNLAADRSGMSVHYAPGPGQAQLRFAVRIFTDAGVTGEYVPNRSRAKVIMAACEALAHTLIGTPALAREQHYRRMRRATKHVGEVGIGALDIALWDIAGKHQGVSVSEMLGGFRTRLKTYASTLHADAHPDGLSSPEAYADFAEQCLELGYCAYKVHGWGDGNVERECALLRAVARRVGDKMTLMYDGSCVLSTFADAVRLGRVCDELGLFWLEDPYADGGLSINGHRMLKQHVKTPLLITEHVRTPETNLDVVAAGASDFARADPDYDCGITGCYKIGIAAETLGIDTEVHSCGPAMRHLMSALRASNYYEMNLLHPVAGNAWSMPIYTDGYGDELDSVDANSEVSVPDGPGLGVSYDWDYIKAHTISRVVID